MKFRPIVAVAMLLLLSACATTTTPPPKTSGTFEDNEALIIQRIQPAGYATQFISGVVINGVFRPNGSSSAVVFTTAPDATGMAVQKVKVGTYALLHIGAPNRQIWETRCGALVPVVTIVPGQFQYIGSYTFNVTDGQFGFNVSNQLDAVQAYVDEAVSNKKIRVSLASIQRAQMYTSDASECPSKKPSNEKDTSKSL